MAHRPFESGVRPLPNGAEDSRESLEALLAECQAELKQLDQMSPLSLREMQGEGRGKMNRLKEQYRAEGRYGEAFIKRRTDLAVYIFDMHRQKSGLALRSRQLGLLWEAFQKVRSQAHELDPTVGDGFGGGKSPDSISDGLSQGIGLRQYL